ncbi:hypothetical protein KAR28_00970 [Candidatus Parcubacteria bacterium]|nr:hypothetical protein [Candidatus Parcubacteria bacterium]
MKKAITACLLLVFVLAGCIGQTNDKQNEGSETTLGRNRMPDFGQPEEPAEIRGLVKTITGNEVTILKIARPQMDEDNNHEEDEGDESDRTQRPVSGFSGHGTGMGMGIGTRQNTGASDSDERLAMLKSMSAGEEKVIIPVGIKMLKNEEGEMVEATLNDVKKDRMLMVWTDETITDRNIANFVIIN